MTDVVTLLDAAHAAVSADPDNEALRLRFFERLADGEMVILLEREAVGESLEPRVFDLWITKVSRCPRVRNWQRWGCNSYAP